MNILICSIVRNEARHLDRWYSQLKRTVVSLPEHTFTLSVYENDSDDGSSAKIQSFDWSFLSSYVIVNAKLNCPFFVGGKHPARTELLAYVRNQCMNNSPFLAQMDKVLWIEPDIEYTHDAIDRIINHEKYYNIKTDVFTGKSVHPGTDGIYDSWGTRRTPNQTDWIDGDEDGDRLQPMWSVFNCLVIYNAEPIKRGIMFGGVNKRTGQPDCDTVVIVENFRANGYDKIFWHKDIKITHYST
jgi:hypothetical protein